MNLYATADDLDQWIDLSGQDVDDVTEKLRSATLLVAVSAGRNPYDTAVDASAAVLKDATLAQAAAWLRGKVDPVGGPAAVAGVAKSKTVADVSITYDTVSAATREQAITMLAPDAYRILYTAGLLVTDMIFWDGADQSLIPDWSNPAIRYRLAGWAPPPWNFL